MAEPSDIPFPSPPSSSSTSTVPSGRSKRSFYTTPTKPQLFSRSAAKRDSVIALGSIAHLQHYFVKHGLASKENPRDAKHYTLAIPHDPLASSSLGHIGEDDDEGGQEHIDSIPAPPPPPSRPGIEYPVGRTEPELTDLEAGRKLVALQLDVVCQKWGIVGMSTSRLSSDSRGTSKTGSLSSLVDTRVKPTTAGVGANDGKSLSPVPELLHITTKAVRCVQRFLSILPPSIANALDSTQSKSTDGSPSNRNSRIGLSTAARPVSVNSNLVGGDTKVGSGTSPGAGRAGFLVPSLGNATSSSSIGSSSATSTSAIPYGSEDLMTTLRKSSLAVLGALRDLELRHRVPGTESSVQWTEEASTLDVESGFLNDEEGSNLPMTPPKIAWDYKPDIKAEELNVEAEVIGEWLEAVDRVLSRVERQLNGGQSRRKQRSTLGLNDRGKGDFSIDDSIPYLEIDDVDVDIDDEVSEGGDDVPIWARTHFTSGISLESTRGLGQEVDRLKRLFLCLVAYLPVSSLAHLQPPDGEDGSPEAFLESLSDGTLLCIAYNSAVRKSKRPWGFIPEECIHDVYSLRTPSQSPVIGYSPSTSSKSPPMLASSSMSRSVSASSGTGAAVVGLTFRKVENLTLWSAALKLRYLAKPRHSFSVKGVARREDGWMHALRSLVEQWVDSVAGELRE